MSPITTHILDTSLGRPASGVPVTLEQKLNGNWKIVSEGETDNDGRIKNLVSEEVKITPGIYKLVFDTKSYFEKQKVKAFYPSVNIEFEITDDSHYHVPLLLNPFGYSTYRGS